MGRSTRRKGQVICDGRILGRIYLGAKSAMGGLRVGEEVKIGYLEVYATYATLPWRVPYVAYVL